MPSGNSPHGQAASAAPELIAALHLLAPAVGDAALAWNVCQDAALAPSDSSYTEFLSDKLVESLCASGTPEDVSRQIASLGLNPQQLHAVAARLSGVLLGASFGNTLAFELITLKDFLNLKTDDCLRLITTVWPQIMYEGCWARWYGVLKNIAEETSLKFPPHAALDFLEWLSICARWLGDFENGQNWIEQALQLASGEHMQEAYARFSLASGVLQRLRGRLLSAQSTVQFARNQFEQQANNPEVQRCNIELAQIALENDEPQRAVEWLTGMPDSAQIRALRAEAFLASGDYQQAAALLLEMPAASRPNLGRAHSLLGKAYLRAGRLDLANATVIHAADILHHTDDVLGYARTLALQGEILFETGDSEAAIEVLEQACRSQHEVQDHAGLRLTLHLLLKVYPPLIEEVLDQNRLDQAQMYTTRLVEHSQAIEQLQPLL